MNPLVFLDVATRNNKLGRIIVEVYQDKVPRTSKNFIDLATGEHGYGYKGCKFHRIIPGFMIQTGDFEKNDGRGGKSIYGKYFEDESFNIRHDKSGLLSMANCGPNTNGSQFFITVGMTAHLDGKHVVFGEVKQGMDIVKEIENYGSNEGEPTKEIRIIDCGLFYNINKN